MHSVTAGGFQESASSAAAIQEREAYTVFLDAKGPAGVESWVTS